MGTEVNRDKPCGRPFEIIIRPQQLLSSLSSRILPKSTEFHAELEQRMKKRRRWRRRRRRKRRRKNLCTYVYETAYTKLRLESTKPRSATDRWTDDRRAYEARPPSSVGSRM